MTEEIFKPLALHTAGFGTPIKRDPQNQPIGHFGFFRSPHAEDFPESMAPAAVIHISINDWAKFILLHLGIDTET